MRTDTEHLYMIGGIANFAGSVINSVMQPVMEQLNFNHNLKLQELQNAYNLDMWKMQNEYNSPQSQMQRFKEAGLNPNLIYGQGTSGNASSAPYQTSRVEAPHFGKSAEALAKVFNIEELRTLVAHRKEAEANAKRANALANSTSIDALRNRDIYDAEIALGSDYGYDPLTGKFVFIGTNGDPNTRKEPVGMGKFFLQQKLAENYQKSQLIPYRQKLLGSHDLYLQPQIWMSNFERDHYPVSYWIGQGTKAVHGLSEFTGMFNPSRYLMPMKGSGYITPFGAKYY